MMCFTYILKLKATVDKSAYLLQIFTRILFIFAHFQVYRVQAKEMGYDECHLFLRIVQFEFAPFKHEAGKPPPVFISSILEDESGVDRSVPNLIPIYYGRKHLIFNLDSLLERQSNLDP